MPTDDIIGALVHTQRQVDGLSRQPLHACGGTWTHSATQSITTTGTVLTFNTQIRNSGISVDATNRYFTVNTGGMFVINLVFNFTAAVGHGLYLQVNGVDTDIFVGNNSSTTYHSGIIMKYLQKNHVLSFRLASGANTTLPVVAEDAAAESPILQICQVSPKFSGG
jgi:hypothetical protein